MRVTKPDPRIEKYPTWFLDVAYNHFDEQYLTKMGLKRIMWLVQAIVRNFKNEIESILIGVWKYNTTTC